MTVAERYALRDGVHSAVGRDGVHRLAVWPHAAGIGRLDAAQSMALGALFERPCDGRELDADLRRRLWRGGWLTVTVADGEHDLFTVRPLRPPPPEPLPEPLPDDGDLELSRFAVLHRTGRGLTVESPRAWCDVDLHDPAALTVVGEPAAGPTSAAYRRLRHFLRWAGIAVPPGEDDEPRVRQWSTHELWFHHRSRLGDRGRHGIGGTSWARGVFPPLPARPALPPGPGIDLHRPDLDRVRATDPPLTTVLETRRSTRAHDHEHPLTATQLGEFLFRTARTTDVWTAEGVELVRRPYPAGGALHELELYPVVTNVAGLPAGMYHYDSAAHRLRRVREAGNPAVRRLLRTAGTPEGAPPQVLLVAAARVGRLMWKYEAMAYALTLKHVGVLAQTMYCVATAMGLAVCAMGLGDGDAFTEATGHDPLDECAVGELVLGSLPVPAQ